MFRALTASACVFGLLIFVSCGIASAQGGIDPGGFDQGTVDTRNGGGDPAANTGQTTTTDTGGSTTTGDSGNEALEVTNIADVVPPPVISDDARRRGFVGANSENLLRPGTAGGEFGGVGFVGADSTTVAAGTFGGTTEQPGGAAVGGGQGGAGAATNQTFFIVQRASLRARVVPSFRSNRPPTTIMSSQFQNRLDRIPQTAGLGSGIQVNIQNGNATVNGFVPTAAEAEMIERQLRLEPGIYRIDNRTQFGR